MAGITAAAIGVGGALIGDGIKFFQGQSQKKQAAQIAKNNPFIPEQIPGAVTQATQLAQQNYTNGMPGMTAARQGITQNAANAQAAAAKGASSSGDVLDSANKINAQSQDASQQLALQAASYKSNALGGYEAALNTQGQWEDQLYKNNTLQPYLRAANTAASLQGAGSINESNAIDGAITSVQAGAQEVSNNQYKNQLLKDPKNYNVDANGNILWNSPKFNASGTPSGNNITPAQLSAASVFTPAQAMNTNSLMGLNQLYSA